MDVFREPVLVDFEEREWLRAGLSRLIAQCPHPTCRECGRIWALRGRLGAVQPTLPNQADRESTPTTRPDKKPTVTEGAGRACPCRGSGWLAYDEACGVHRPPGGGANMNNPSVCNACVCAFCEDKIGQTIDLCAEHTLYPRLVAMLRQLEFADGGALPRCPTCWARRSDVHDPDCRLAQLLKEAESCT